MATANDSLDRTVDTPDTLHVCEARDVLAHFTRALKAIRLYPAGNTVVTTSLHDLHRRLAEYLDAHGDLALTVTRAAIHLDGEPVHEDEHSEMNLAFLLTLESVREITIHADVGREEVERFLGILAAVGRNRDDVDDLETLLWQEDLTGISVLILDSFYEDTGDEEEFLEFVEEGRPDPQAPVVASTERKELTEVLGDASAILGRPVRDLGILDSDDHLQLEELLAEEGARDPMATFGAILIDVLGVEDDPAAFARLTGVLGRQLRLLVEQKELLRAARIARDAERLLVQIRDEDRLREVREALAEIPTETVLDELADAVAEADDDGLGDLRALLSRLAGTDPDAIVGLLERSELRDLAVAALQDHLDRLVPYLAARVRDPRAAVARTAVALLGCSKSPRATEMVADAALHPDARVRIAAVRAAAALPGGSAVIERALTDEQEEVRLVALRSPREAVSDAMRRCLERRVVRKDLATCSFLEKREVFHALARFGGSEIVAFLARILARRPLLRRDRTNELRACAASALGAVGTPEALEILDGHLEDRSDRVREAAFGALREASRRRAAPRRRPC